MDFLEDLLMSHPELPVPSQLAVCDEPWDMLAALQSDSAGSSGIGSGTVDIVDTIAVVSAEQPAVPRARLQGWGHWRSLTPEQRVLRGKILRAGKASKAAQLLRKNADTVLRSAVDSLAVRCRVRARMVKGRRFFKPWKELAKKRCGESIQTSSLMNFSRHVGRALTLSPQQCLSIAVLDPAKSAALHDVSLKTARRVGRAVAHITLRSQAVLLKSILKDLESKPPNWACCHLMWDETGEKVVVDVMGNVLRRAFGQGSNNLAVQESLWHVLVARVSFSWGWATTASQRVQLICPPLPLATTKAESLWAGLFSHSAFGDIWAFKEALFARAGLAIDLHTSDDASSNNKLHAHFTNTVGDLHCRLKCLSHQTNICMTTLYSTVGMDLLHLLFCSTMFLRAGNYYLRCVLAARQFVQANLRVISGPPPEHDVQLAMELQDYFQRNYCVEKKAHQSKARPMDRKDWERSLHEFFAVWNGSLKDDGCLTHYCLGPSCCASRAVTEKRAYRAVFWLLHGKPCTPTVSRWTKVGVCVDFWLRGSILCIFRNLLQMAVQDLSFDARTDMGGDDRFNVNNYTDAAEAAAEDFPAVAGRRLARTRELLGDRTHRTRLAILAVIMEPIRRLHVYFLAKSQMRPTWGKPPAICDLLQPHKSILVSVLQYYSSLLCGTGSRLRLIWQLHGGHGSMAEWAASQSETAGGCDLVRVLRRCVLVASASVARRLHKYLCAWPWRLFILGDASSAESERADCASAFIRTRPCCLAPGLARKLRGRVQTADELLTASCATAFQGAGWELKLGIGGIERLHAANRARCKPMMRWHAFAAGMVNAERTTTLSAWGELEALGAEPAAPAVAPPRLEDRLPRRKLSSYDLFKVDFLREQRLAGRVLNPCTAAFHTECKAAFQSLPLALSDKYRAQAETSAAAARLARQRRQAATATTPPPPQPQPSAGSGSAVEGDRPMDQFVPVTTSSTSNVVGFADQPEPFFDCDVDVDEWSIYSWEQPGANCQQNCNCQLAAN